MARKIRYKKVTPEEAEKLEKLGFKLETLHECQCEFCGKKFTSKNEKQLEKRFEKHIDEQCKTVIWMRSTSNVLKIAGLKNVINADLMYLQDGKFPKGCERTKPEELEILNNVKNMLDNWGKEDGVL